MSDIQPPTITDGLDAVREARAKAETIWQAANINDLASGLDLHPLITGLIFELPWSSSGKPEWTQREWDAWIHLAQTVLRMIFVVSDKEAERDATIANLEAEIDDLRGDLEQIAELPDMRARLAQLEAENEQLRDAAKVVELHPDSLATRELRLAVIDRAREGKEANIILGYDLDDRSARRNREARHWTVEHLAGAAGVHPAVIERLESGVKIPQEWQLARIAAAFVLTEDGDVTQRGAS